MTSGILILVAVLGVALLSYGRSKVAYVSAWLGICLLGAGLLHGVQAASPVGQTAYISSAALAWAGALWLGFVLLVHCRPLRRASVSNPTRTWFKQVLPRLSQTEQEALDAGTVGWDGELFSGKPDWQALLDTDIPRLTAEEQAFVDGPTEALCRQINDWQITQTQHDMPPEVWATLKAQRFFGMIIPKHYGGLGFSAIAHSAVVSKIATRSYSAALNVMVPNSLGPAELLLHYGTEAQKNHYLPRLASGEDIPCFALTGPSAGSDAGALPDSGVVCRGRFEGRDIIGIRLNWDKRYITLCPVATLLGLAFKLYDPEHLIGGREELGITLALIPTDTPGVETGRRHFPLNAMFMNGPTTGHDVFIPLDWIIGGVAQAGQGWRMLMDCLSVGRSISLPALAAGSSKLAAYATGAYARVRTQFRTPLGKFEGVEEALARIGANAYVIEAGRTLTAGAVDLGQKPSVLSAILKYHATERMRTVLNDAMDVHGGKAIMMGPRNYLGRLYQAIPVSITVEGANILTRSMMIFGQGAIRCHPFVYQEIMAVNAPDEAAGQRAFDDLLFRHIGFGISNGIRAFALGLTDGRIAASPSPAVARHYQRLTRLAAGFALLADVAMFVLGGELKRREKLSARLGDILSQLYLCSAVLKRFHDDGSPAADLPLVNWAIEDSLYQAQEAADGVLKNFPNRAFAALLRVALFPLGKPWRKPSDALGAEVAALLLQPSPTRERLTNTIYAPRHLDEPMGVLAAALEATIAAEPVEAKLNLAMKRKLIRGTRPVEQMAHAVACGVLTAEEAALLQRARQLQSEVVKVDDFAFDYQAENVSQPIPGAGNAVNPEAIPA